MQAPCAERRRFARAGVAACLAVALACELADPVPRIILGPAVPSPLPVGPPYVWDTADELAVWVSNAVSRGALSIDGSDSNGAIAVRLTGPVSGGPSFLLRGPDLDPPARSIRAVRIRYQWVPENPLAPSLNLHTAFDTPDPAAAATGQQPHASVTLRPGGGWTDVELSPYLRPLDVKYVYCWAYSSTAGLLKIDAIMFVD